MRKFWSPALNLRRIPLALILTATVLCNTHAQATDAAGSSAGPSLEETLLFIADRMNEQGKFELTAYIHDATSGQDSTRSLTMEMGKVKFDTAKCTISQLKLKDVRDIVIDPDISHFVTMHPASLQITGVDRQTPLLTVRYNGHKQKNWVFPFHEPEMADRVAKALIHAVELCGGGKPDPF